MASISDRDRFAYGVWDSRSYPFEVQQAGRMVYLGRARGGHGSWEGTGQVGYITLNGDLQTLEWKVPAQHRPVRLIVYHEDAGGVPSAANVNVDYYYFDKGMNKWVLFGGGISTEATYNEGFGETHERQDVHYRLTLQGPNGHIIWVTPYNQYLQGEQFRTRRQGL